MNRVFITGAGVLSPFGLGSDILWKGLMEDRSAVRNMADEWKPFVKDLDSLVGAPIIDAPPERDIPRKIRKTMGKSAQFSYWVTLKALEDSGIGEDLLQGGRLGISFGSTSGSAEALYDFFKAYFESYEKRNINSSAFFKIMSHTNAANLAQAFNVAGRVLSPNSACSSASQALGLGYETIKYGIQDIMLCGGAEELHFTTTSVFDIVQAASVVYNDRPEMTPRPFDKDRDGTVCGEGAGCLVLESEESALRRNAPIYGEIIGYATCASGSHIATPDAQSIEHCMRLALKEGGVEPGDIDLVNAHATGTPVGDSSEASAIANVFGNDVAVNSLKGHIGHTLGASGAIELLACLNMMEKGIIIPTRNYQKPDPEFQGLNIVGKKITGPVRTVLKNSSAFGGINTSMIIRRMEAE